MRSLSRTRDDHLGIIWLLSTTLLYLLLSRQIYCLHILSILFRASESRGTGFGNSQRVEGKMRRISSPLLLAAVCFTTSAAANPSNVFERASTCADQSYTQCSEPGIPSSFCCPQSESCIPLAANTTVLCCPNGSDCASIQPITCDISKQNATLNPGATLQTTALTSTLGTCGTGCCPFGYTCNTNGQCIMNADQDTAPPVPTSSSSTTSSPTTSSTSTQPASVIPVASSNGTTPLTAASCTKFPAPAVLVGFFPGLVAGVLLTLASVCLLTANRHKATRRLSGSSFGNISDPQPSGASGGEMRTDFLRKQPATPSTGVSSTPTRRNTIGRIRSVFRKSTSPNGMGGGSPRPAPVPPIPLNVQRPMMQMAHDRPITPHLQREPSYEDINIFADGDTASALRERERLDAGGRTMRASQQTTFTDMMERSGLAGLQKGQRE